AIYREVESQIDDLRESHALQIEQWAEKRMTAGVARIKQEVRQKFDDELLSTRTRFSNLRRTKIEELRGKLTGNALRNKTQAVDRDIESHLRDATRKLEERRDETLEDRLESFIDTVQKEKKKKL